MAMIPILTTIETPQSFPLLLHLPPLHFQSIRPAVSVNLTANDLELGMIIMTTSIPIGTENEVLMPAIPIMMNEVEAERGRDVSSPILRIIAIVTMAAALRKDDLQTETVLMVDRRIETETPNHFTKRSVESEKLLASTC